MTPTVLRGRSTAKPCQTLRYQSLATVVVGGLVTATALTLLLLPALYYLIEAHLQKRQTDTEGETHDTF